MRDKQLVKYYKQEKEKKEDELKKAQNEIERLESREKELTSQGEKLKDEMNQKLKEKEDELKKAQNEIERLESREKELTSQGEKLKDEMNQKLEEKEAKIENIKNKELIVRKKLDEYIENYNTKVSKFLNYIKMSKHDIKGHFSPINSKVKFLAQQLSNQEQRNLIKEIEEKIRLMEDGTLRALEEAKYALDQTGDVIAIDVTEVIYESIEHWAKVAEPNVELSPGNIKFTHEHKIKIDPVALNSVISNVFKNAIEAMEENSIQGRIIFETQEKVSESEQEGFIELFIGNDGPEIPQEDWEKIFNPKYTTKSEEGRGPRGSGLAIARSIIRNQGGDIAVAISSSKVTKFRVTLPIDIEHKVSNFELKEWERKIKNIINELNIKSETAPFLKKKKQFKILIVDDKKDACEDIINLINNINLISQDLELIYDVADDAKAAISLGIHNYYDIVICDIVLDLDSAKSDMDGFDVLREIKIKHPSTFLCAYSGTFGKKVTWKPDESLSCDAQIKKKMTIEELEELIGKAKIKHREYEKDTFQKQNEVTTDENQTISSLQLQSKLCYALIDDVIENLEDWKSAYNRYEDSLHTFSSPKEFEEALKNDTSLRNNLQFIITDFYFKNTKEEGTRIFEIIEEADINIPIILLTSLEPEDYPPEFDKIIDKTYNGIPPREKLVELIKGE